MKRVKFSSLRIGDMCDLILSGPHSAAFGTTVIKQRSILAERSTLAEYKCSICNGDKYNSWNGSRRIHVCPKAPVLKWDKPPKTDKS